MMLVTRQDIELNTIHPDLARDFETWAILAYEEYCKDGQGIPIFHATLCEENYEHYMDLVDLYELTIAKELFSISHWDELDESDVEVVLDVSSERLRFELSEFMDDIELIWDTHNFVYISELRGGLYGQYVEHDLRNSPLQEVW